MARVLAVLGSVAAIGLVFRRLDPGALGAVFSTMDWAWFLAAQGVFGLGLLGSAVRWHLMLRLNSAVVVHAAASVRMVFISQFFNTLFGGPSGGDVPKTAVYSRWYGVPAAEVLASSVLDRLSASAGGLLFVLVSLIAGWWSGAFGILAGGAFRVRGSWVAAAVLGGAAVVAVLLGVARRWPDSFAGRAVRSLGRSASWLLASKRRSGHALGCAVVTAFLFNFTQILCLRAVAGREIPVAQLLWLYQAVTMVASLPVTFAGAGLREGTAMVLLAPYGIPPATAVAGALLTLSIHITWAGVGAVLLWREQGRHRRRRAAAGPSAPPAKAERVSVVVPVLNEAEALGFTVDRLRRVRGVEEIIVADGGSTDGTRELAARLGCVVVEAPRGRGHQLRAGAARARADVILLVHADTWLPPEAWEAVRHCLRDPLVVGGGFWKSFRDAPWMMRGSRFRCWLRLWWSGRVLGDQALFVRRSVLEAVGGVPPLPLMEEVELCRRLRSRGRLALAGARVTTSIRRFRTQGIWRTYWRMWRVSRGFRRGVDPAELVRWYEGR